MYSTEALLTRLGGPYNYLELARGECLEAFPQNYFPLFEETSSGLFVQRERKVHTMTEFERRIYVLVKEDGTLFEDSLSQFYDVPSYPCRIAMLIQSLKHSQSNPLELRYITEWNDVSLQKTTVEEGTELTIQSISLPPGVYKTLYDNVMRLI